MAKSSFQPYVVRGRGPQGVLIVDNGILAAEYGGFLRHCRPLGMAVVVRQLADAFAVLANRGARGLRLDLLVVQTDPVYQMMLRLPPVEGTLERFLMSIRTTAPFRRVVTVGPPSETPAAPSETTVPLHLERSDLAAQLPQIVRQLAANS